MNYSAMIQNRKSVRSFRSKGVSSESISEIRTYFDKECMRLFPEIETQLVIVSGEAQKALEGSAGYEKYLIGAPHYLVLLSAPHENAGKNAGYLMEDMILKLTEMEIDSCWLTFTNSERVKFALSLSSPLEVVAIVAFGYGERTRKALRLNIQNVSKVDISILRQYYAPKKSINELVSVGKWGCKDGLDELMLSYGDMLWRSFYAASLSPSYLNRQPYGFLLREHELFLIQTEDAPTDPHDGELDLGIVLLHFSAVAAQWMGVPKWTFGRMPDDILLPEGCRIVAVCHI